MSIRLANERGDLLIAATFFGTIGAALIALGLAKRSTEQASAVGSLDDEDVSGGESEDTYYRRFTPADQFASAQT